MNLDLAARSTPTLLRHTAYFDKLSSVAWHKAAFLVFWEGQGHLSSITYVALVAFVNIWLAFGAMFVWSVLATLLFCAARERGYPNLLSELKAPERRAGHLASYAFGSVMRAWFGGLNAFVYARCSRLLLVRKEGCCKARRIARVGVLVLGLTLFGVTSAEHLLRTAGYNGRKLLRMSLIGPFLHVPYRLMVSAAVVAVITDAVDFVAVV
jgi:hypothetical protein